MTSDSKQWFFTFPQRFDKLKDCYVLLSGSFAGTRQYMFEHYGEEWAFQYPVEELAEQADQFGLTSVPIEEAVRLRQEHYADVQSEGEPHES